MRPEQIRLFTQQLAALVSAGVPLSHALETIAQGMHPASSQKEVAAIHQKILQGQSLHQALDGLSGFGHFYGQLIAAGEMAGNLDVMLHRLSLHLNKQHQLNKTVRGALVYPLSVLLIAVVVVAVILIWVVPVFQGIFASFGAEMPFATRMVLAASNDLARWGWMLLTGLFFAIYVVHKSHQLSPSFQMRWCHWQLNLPALGSLVRLTNLAIWTRCMSTLVNASVPLLDSLEVTAGVCPNKWFGLASFSIRQAVSHGRSMAWAANNVSQNKVFPTSLFPVMLVQMIRIGEESGALAQLLDKAAGEFETSLEQQVQAMTQLIEPVMVVVLGVLVGGLVVALYLPVFQLGQIM